MSMVSDLSQLSVSELDKVIKQYPWFALARRELFLRMASLGEEYREEGVKKVTVYLFSREKLFKEERRLCKERKEVEFLSDEFHSESLLELETPPLEVSSIEIDLSSPIIPQAPIVPIEIHLEEEHFTVHPVIEAPSEEKAPVEEEKPLSSEQKPRIHIVGGDYFAKEDFNTLQQDGLSTIQRLRSLAPSCEPIDFASINTDAFDDEQYYTETLAKIYARQGFNKRAIEVYEKLILLYPEKSTYFAALKEEQKKYL